MKKPVVLTFVLTAMQYSARCIGSFSQSEWFGALKRRDGYQQSSGHEIHEAVAMIQQGNDAKRRTLQGGRMRPVRRKGIVSPVIKTVLGFGE
jgi:hypothetical protein